jgi:predicted Holliday junction resolvase-like endonuclease
LKSKYSKVLSQKKSSEVVTGHIAEQLAPFLDNFPYDPKQVKFLGQPIDYIHYGDDQITFIEVKSGKSRLSKKQKHIKQLIENNQVFWDEVRIHGKN